MPDAKPDARPDAMPDAAVDLVRFRKTGDGVPASPLGTPMGNQREGLQCPADELPIGAAFDVTDNVVAAHGLRVVTSLHLRCGKVELVDGAPRTTPTARISTLANACATYAPVTTSAEALCPAGTVLLGLTGNHGTGSMFNNVSLQCAALVGGVVTGTLTAVAVTGTGGDTNLPDVTQCVPPRALGALKSYVDCGADAVLASCFAITSTRL